MTSTWEKTIAREGKLEGIGLHTGEKCTVHFRPAPSRTGVRFLKKGQAVAQTSDPGSPFVFESARCTLVGRNGLQIQTVEHLSAALFGLGINNIIIDVDGSELPGLDGSAKSYVEFLKTLGLVNQEAPREVYRVREPLFCHEPGKALAIYPAEEFSVSYVLDYDHPFLRNQEVSFTLKDGVFEKEIAPARTFCTEEEAAELRRGRLGLGATTDNTLVMTKSGVLSNTLRFPDECARHKVLDLMGDLGLMGFSVLGRVVGLRSGHSLNRKLAEKIKEQRATMTSAKKTSKTPPLGLEQIKNVLPHRYPFLLVDRILEIDEKTAVGLKNVTGNEPFFQGHFPNRPVMPGVLIVEALAQVGGFLVLSKGENQGKIAYLASITNARFRKVVVPGDQLRLEVEVLRLKSKVGMIKAAAKVDGEEVCDAEMMFSLAD